LTSTLAQPSADTEAPTRDADYELLKIMWARAGWDPPFRGITSITRNTESWQEWRRRQPLVVPPNRDRGLWYDSPSKTADMPDGEPYQLIAWKLRQVAKGITLAPGLQDLVSSHQHDDKMMNKLVKRAINRARGDENADKGTARHKTAELEDFGLSPGPQSPRMRADLDAYHEVTRAFVMVLGEMFVVDDVHKLGGTFDRVAWYEPDKCYYILDLKPPDSGYGQGAKAIQFAIYQAGWLYNWSLAQYWLDRDPKKLPELSLRSPLPQPMNDEYAIMVHVPRNGAGRAYTARVNIGHGRTGRRIAAEMRRWQDQGFQDSLVIPFEPEIKEFTPATPPLVLDVGRAPRRTAVRVADIRDRRAATTPEPSPAAQRALGAAPDPADDGPLEPTAEQQAALTEQAVLTKIRRAKTVDDLRKIYTDHQDLWVNADDPIPTEWRDKRVELAPLTEARKGGTT